MPIEIRCPKCQSLFRLPDETAGKTIRCQKCQATFPVPGGSEIKPGPAPSAPVASAPATPAGASRPAKRNTGFIAAVIGLAAVLVLGLGIAVTMIVVRLLAPPLPDPVAKGKEAAPPAKKDQSNKVDPKRDDLTAPRDKPIEKKPALAPPIEVVFGPAGFEDNRSVKTESPRDPDDAKQARYQAYRLPLVAGSAYEFALVPTGFRAVAGLRLFDPDGKFVGEHHANGAGAPVRLDFKAIRTGAHRLHVVSASDGEVRYRLAITRDGAVVTIVPIKVSLRDGRFEAEAELTDRDARSRDGKKRRKQFAIALEAGRSYVLEMTRLDRSLEPCLELYGPDGKLIVAREFDGKIPGARIVFNPKESGTHALDATSSGDERGKFALSIVQQETLPFVFASSGQAKVLGALEPADPADPRTGQPAKTYDVRLDAAKGYSFELRNNAFDALLQLFDPAGKLVAEDDDTTGGVPARILVEPKAAGAYQLRVGAAKKELGKYTLQGLEIALPRPVASDAAVPVQKAVRADKLPVRFVTLGASEQGHDLLWSADGAALLVRDGNLGAVRRIRLKDLVEERHLAIGPDAGAMGLCSAGLIVPKKATRDLWILDPAMLELSRRLAYFGKEVASAPDFPLLMQIAGGQNNGKPVTGFVLTDARKGAPRPRFVELDNLDLAASPDGRSLLVHGPDRRLARYRFDGKGPALEETAPHPSPVTKLPISFRADGLFMAALFDKELEPDDKAEPAPASGKGALVYAIGKLGRPAFAIDTGKRPTALAFDPLKRFVYAGNDTGAVGVFNAKGKQRELQLSLPDNELPSIRKIAPHPEGSLLAVLTDGGTLYLVELPADLAAQKAETQTN
jgi:predicted Zn finger-like uncharacterized protein